MGDLIGTQLNGMNYLPEVEPKDYLVTATVTLVGVDTDGELIRIPQEVQDL